MNIQPISNMAILGRLICIEKRLWTGCQVILKLNKKVFCYCRRRVREMKNYNFSFPSRGEQKGARIPRDSAADPC